MKLFQRFMNFNNLADLHLCMSDSKNQSIFGLVNYFLYSDTERGDTVLSAAVGFLPLFMFPSPEI